MSKASYLQTSFLGGEWSPYAQGGMDNRAYRSALNVCRNSLPVEEGAWTRRPGTRWLEDTRKGFPGKLLTFHFSEAAPYSIELTDGYLRFFSGNSLVTEPQDFVVTGATTATPAELTLNEDHGWVSGNAITLSIQAGQVQEGVADLLSRTFQIIVSATNKVQLYDPLTDEAIDGTGLDLGDVVLGVERVLEFVTPYTAGEWAKVNVVQDETHVLLLHPTIKTRVVTDVTVGDGPRTFTFGIASFLDGPYLDPPPDDDGSFLTPSGISGTITLTETGGFYSFVSTDVGRLLRLYSQPPAWVTGTTYAIGDSVTYSNNTWTALTVNHGKKPDISLDDWALDPAAARWTWAKIATVGSTAIVTATIEGDPLLSTSPIAVFRLGTFSDTTGWPTCGTLHESRLWLGGVFKNRFDASMSNEFLRFDPTGTDGSVADNNGISEVLRSPSGRNTILWMATDDQGVLMGTQAGEWLIRSSSLNDPLTPTSIQAHQMTTYGSRNVQPVLADMSTAFVNRHGRKLLEYTAYGEAAFGGTNLSRDAKHLAADGLAELAYQKELVPMIWARTDNGQLIGCTYRRDNPLGTQAATFAGWHRHDLGSGKTVTSIQTGPSLNGELDSLMMITLDATTGFYAVELLTELFDEDTPIYEAWFVDSGMRPTFAKVVGSTIVLYGLHHLEGRLVSVFAAGVDAGDFTVAAGKITIPFDTASTLLSAAWLAAITAINASFENTGVYILNPPTGDLAVVDGLNILRYTRGSGQVAKTTFGGPVPLWELGQFFSLEFGSPGDSPTSGLRKFDISTGAMIDDRSNDNISYPADASAHSGAASLNDSLCSDPDGYLYWNASLQNYGTLVKLDPNVRKVGTTTYPAYHIYGHIGVANSGSGVGFPPHKPMGPLPDPGDGNDYGIPLSDNTLASKAGSNTYVFSAASFHSNWSAQDGIHVVLGNTMTWLKAASPGTYTGGKLCHAPTFTKGGFTWGSAYLLGNRLGGIVADPLTSVGLFRLGAKGTTQTNASLSIQTIGTILPTDVDAAFSNFSTFDFGVRDETDGHLIGSCEGDTGTKYIVKINSKTAAIMWATVVDAVPSSTSLRLSRCTQGQYAFYSNTGAGPWNYYVFDTTTGAKTTIMVAGVQRLSTDQAFDDLSGRVIFKGSLGAAGPNVPLPVSPTPATFTEDWLCLPGTPSTIPYPPALTNYYAPISVGYTYTSQGQILRPIAPEETGALNGPALGKTRRQHMYSALIHKTQGISVGTVFGKLNTMKLKTPGGSAYPLTTLYSGTIQDTLTDDYSFDSMIAWEITRPYPATVLTIGGFIQTQDR